MFILFRYSYVGQLQHNNENIAESEAKLVSYTKQKWAYGSVVGVYLNRWQGTLAFYLDRQLLGIAFRGNLISFVIEKIFLNQKFPSANYSLNLIYASHFRSSQNRRIIPNAILYSRQIKNESNVCSKLPV